MRYSWSRLHFMSHRSTALLPAFVNIGIMLETMSSFPLNNLIEYSKALAVPVNSQVAKLPINTLFEVATNVSD